MPYSIVGFAELADRSGTAEAITPIGSDDISDVSGDELKISSIPRPTIAWIYTKASKAGYPVNSWQLNSPEIAAIPLTGTGGDAVAADSNFGTVTNQLTIDTRLFPSDFGFTSSSPLTCTMDTDDEAGVSQSASMILGIMNAGESLPFNPGYARVDYHSKITGFSGNATVNSFSSYSLTSSGLTYNSLPDIPVRIINARVETPNGTCFRFIFPTGNSSRPGGLISNNTLTGNPAVNNFFSRPFRAISEHPLLEICTSTAETITSVEIDYQIVR
jgi:hypothetical protein